ncbi:MAG: trehalose-phosphatase [Candidatus Margulisbacteria bacterium]|nr:trehalose-phosphatase [Candidatus Margulisiibacteriota bacterium]MBU1021622.1 trehalose-phosphatase [Candidatus Margulisiibacteriota bacterium]MBU1728772.1 trehalose-phosphatase [Candidatus Margulisiibacteriota bacterium]MBU1955738.1 trehalose-phosphatase [Candidatus Margulisiibacteriota bacterium]
MKYILLLDYDGTLTPIVKTPELAKLSSANRRHLKKLAETKDLTVCIVSGRALKDIKNKVKIPDIYYIGNHGFEMEGPQGKMIQSQAKKYLPLMSKIKKDLKPLLKIKGVIVEDKKFTLSVHYRLASPSGARKIKALTEKYLKPYAKAKRIRVTYGKKVIEIRPPIKWDKGKAVLWILNALKIKDAIPIYIGDDVTDEDAFRVLKKIGVAVRVGRAKKSCADYFLREVGEVYKLLHFIQNVIESSPSCVKMPKRKK